VEDIGRLAVEILVHEIGRKVAGMDKQRVLPTQLLIRKSCGA
jgi:DNA-binding LacI/PurR family transcriptional regulator